jgi:hypothetical protein
MRFTYILFLLLFSKISFSSSWIVFKTDSDRTHKYISKLKVVHLIDSILDLETVSPEQLDQLSYYCRIFKNESSDSTRISDFNLFDLSFYSASDEKILFPLTDLDSIPGRFELTLENDYLSFYFAPFKGVVTSPYGWRQGRMHKGVDIDLNKGDEVCAAFNGKVRVARKQGGFGNVVILMHPNGMETVYAHLSRIKVSEGDIVFSGQTIGLGGSTGHSTGPHLHFELRYRGHSINPGNFISFTEHKLLHHTVMVKNSKRGLCAFPNNSNLHTVSRGETWSAIAEKFGLTIKELMALNGCSKRFYLRTGQTLRIN